MINKKITEDQQQDAGIMRINIKNQEDQEEECR